MKVKILSSKSPMWWYYRLIGSEIYVNYFIDDSIDRYHHTVDKLATINTNDAVITELPESFCVKRCDDEEKWKKYIDWLNKTCKNDFGGYGVSLYYGSLEGGGWYAYGSFGTEIHIDDIIKHIDYMKTKDSITVKYENGKFIEVKEEFNMNTVDGRLAYAKKHYPIGCTVIEVSGEKFKSKVKEIHTSVNNSIKLQFGAGLLYNNITGEWAEIIKEEEFDLTTNEGRLAYAKKHYPIGTKYIPLYSNGENWNSDGIKIIPCDIQLYGIDKLAGGYGYIYANGKWAEIIKEEKNMKTQKLSRQGLKEIHSVACSEWKNTLEQYGSRNPLEDYIELSQKEIDTMFLACTLEQERIISKYLKKDNGSVDVTKFNVSGKGFCDDDFYIIRDREWGEYKKQSFLLSERYDWEIKTDGLGQLCLIPTKKK